MKKTENTEYTATMTGNPFLYRETRIVVKMVCAGYDDGSIREEVINRNAFQCDKKNTNLKHLAEIKLRLSLLPADFAKLIDESDAETSRLILFYALLVRYRLLREFMAELLYEKLMLMEPLLRVPEVDIWLAHKKEQDDKVATWTESTMKKVKQVLLKMAVEAGYLKKEKSDYRILNVMVPKVLTDEIQRTCDAAYRKYFLIR
ncbi:MAG TPA: DUF1819 family protein [Candidatus Wallbacteria bacterium]|nr:DUF1819 family protein [Candidatus Wallbacteria bacterium]